MKLSIFPISLRGKHNESPTNGLVICIDFPAPEQTTPQQWVRSRHAIDRKPQPLHVHLSSFILRFSPFKDDWNWHPLLTHLVCLARQKKRSIRSTIRTTRSKTPVSQAAYKRKEEEKTVAPMQSSICINRAVPRAKWHVCETQWLCKAKAKRCYSPSSSLYLHSAQKKRT